MARPTPPSVVRCYIEGRGEAWEALCLDFDIAVQGRSFDEVFAGLHAAIREYLDYVRSLPEPEQLRFLRRRAPLSTRLKLAYRVLANALLRWPSDDGWHRHDFTMPCTA